MVEVVQIEKFKSKDGCVYDTLKNAERADQRWVSENEFDVDVEVAMFGANGRKTLASMIHRTFFGDRKSFPRLVIFHGKHGDDINVIANPSKLPGVYLNKLKLQQPYGFYDTDSKSRAVAKAIFDTNNEFAAMEFLEGRASYDYERITSEYVPVL